MDLTNIQIMYYKQFSNMHRVNYKSIVHEQWATPPGDDAMGASGQSRAGKDDDRQKKMADINFGMLEKSKNMAQRRACNCQKKQGGRIYALEEETQERDEETERDIWALDAMY